VNCPGTEMDGDGDGVLQSNSGALVVVSLLTFAID
jgi:hypothetical protein